MGELLLLDEDELGGELLDGEDEIELLEDGELDELGELLELLELELDRELLDEEGGLVDDEEDELHRQLQPFGLPIRTPYRLQCSGATAFLP